MRDTFLTQGSELSDRLVFTKRLTMNHSLISDLKDLLREALKTDDYAKVRKFAGYLEELTAEKVSAKRGKRAKPAQEEKVAKKRGRPAKAKPVTEAAAEAVREEDVEAALHVGRNFLERLSAGTR